MANPLYSQLGGNPTAANQPQQPNDGGFGAMMAQFQQFCQQYKGNPGAEIDQLVKSGKVTQAQVDQARQMASQFMRLMPHK